MQETIRNVIFVWTLTGIWHGANWTFLAWGLLYCCFQLLERYVYDTSKWPKVIGHIYTLVIVCLCWVIFRADSLKDAALYILNMFGRNGIYDEHLATYAKSSAIILVVAGIIASPVMDKFILGIIGEAPYKHRTAFAEVVLYCGLVAILIMSALISISGGYSPFIYFNF